MVKAPASWNSIAWETCSSAEHSIDGGREYCDLALIVLEDAVEGDSGLSFESLNRNDGLPCSVDGLPRS